MGLNRLVAFGVIALTLGYADAAKADGFSNGQFVTYTQSDWSASGVAASLSSPPITIRCTRELTKSS
jgi:hypothetical protein